MDDIREKAIEAAKQELYRLARKTPGTTFDGGFDAGFKFCLENLGRTIDAYERAMLEAGWKMTPYEPSSRMLDSMMALQDASVTWRWMTGWEAASLPEP